MSLAALPPTRIPVLDLERWSRPANACERRLLQAATGPVLDVGCGPGRAVAVLRDRGLSVLGIDAAPTAIARAEARGVLVTTKSVFDSLPDEGTWATVLLLDGNIGIGGDPQRLLARVRDLLSDDGRALVEVEPPGSGVRRGLVEFEVATGMVGWFPWCWVGADAIAALGESAGLRVEGQICCDARWFTWLRQRS